MRRVLNTCYGFPHGGNKKLGPDEDARCHKIDLLVIMLSAMFTDIHNDIDSKRSLVKGDLQHFLDRELLLRLGLMST